LEEIALTAELGWERDQCPGWGAPGRCWGGLVLMQAVLRNLLLMHFCSLDVELLIVV